MSSILQMWVPRGAQCKCTEHRSAAGVATVSSFLMLQPNFLGFGINFNAIIDYPARRKPKDPQTRLALDIRDVRGSGKRLSIRESLDSN